ncbi:hypothetical protein PanWU01x14_217180, partial [Parasponia andersonii]
VQIPFLKNLHHLIVDLNGDNLISNFQKLHSEISSSGSDFQDCIHGSYGRFSNN